MGQIIFDENKSKWRRVSLEETLLSGKAGGTPPSTNPNYYGGNVPFLSISDVSKQGKYVINTEKTLTEEGVKNSSAWIVPSGSLIYAMYASVGKMCINQVPIATSQALFSMKFKDNYDLNFMYYVLSWFNENQLEQFITTGTQGNINAQTLKKFELFVPSLPEQRKIAGFLSSLDDRIELQSKKIELLKQQKKGYVQRIFSQKLRFHDDNGNPYPEWKEETLATLGETYAGLSGKTKSDFASSAREGYFPFIPYSSIYNYTVLPFPLNTYVSVKDNERQNRVEKNDILFTGSSETPKDAAKASLWRYDENVYLNSFCFGYRIKDTVVVYPPYFVQMLNSPRLRIMLSSCAQGSTRYNVSKASLLKLKVPLPSLPEQKKIADFLGALDERIAIEEEKLKLYKQEKQGFMQRIFS